MDLWVTVCDEERIYNKADGSGVWRNLKNVIRSVEFDSNYASFAIMKAAIEQNENTKVSQITEAQYNSLINDLTIDEHTGIPKWQVNFDESGEIGSWADPEDTQTTWNVDTPIDDFRYRLKIRHNDSFSGGENSLPTIANNFPDTVILNQYDKTTGEPNNRVAVGIELFNKTGDKISSFNAPNFIFYNGTTPTVADFVNGYAIVYIRTDEPTARDHFKSNHEYRIDNDNRQINIIITSRTLND